MNQDNSKNRFCEEGEVFSEILEVEGQKFEHLGMKFSEEVQKQFEEFLATNVGRKIRVCLEVLD